MFRNTNKQLKEKVEKRMLEELKREEEKEEMLKKLGQSDPSAIEALLKELINKASYDLVAEYHFPNNNGFIKIMRESPFDRYKANKDQDLY